VSWKDNSTYNFSHYHIIISNQLEEINAKAGICDENFQNTGNCTFARANNFTSIVFYGLDPGVYYSVSMFTSILGVLSKKSIQKGTYTRMIILFLFNYVFILSLVLCFRFHVYFV
jgi:hypothetical protein